MRLLLFSDLHANARAASNLVRLAVAADVIIGAGDFANARRDIHTCIDVLRATQKRAVLVPGNNESLEELANACAAWPSATVLHGNSTTIADVTFFGLGGGVPVTPFGPWSWDFSEEQARSLLLSCPMNCVLISHSPPKGAVDTSSSGKSLGSTAVRETIGRTKPRLVVCGHIHASAGQSIDIGQSRVINAGPAGSLYVLS